jgi:peroxiredoxin Q/BCP
MPGFEDLGARVVGVSRDKLASQQRFAERNGLPFPLLSDETGSVLRDYGVRGLFGFAKRKSFLIDPEGIVRRVYAKVSPRGHAAEVLGDLQAIGGA